MAVKFNEQEWADATAEASGWEPSVVIDTEESASKFERALTAACTGVHDGTNQEAEEIAKTYDGPDLGEVIGVMTDANGHRRRCAIHPTPGWSNEGRGEFYRVTPERPARWPAYMSVRIPLTRPLTPAELAGIVARARSFASSGGPTLYGFQMTRPFTVTGFRLLRTRIVSEWVTVEESKL